MTYVVTGASGVVGRALTQALLPRGRVRALSRRDTGDLGTAEVVRWDLENLEIIDSLLVGADAVFHAAAHIPLVHDAKEEAQRCLCLNAVATDAIVRSAIAARVRVVVLFSAGNAYAPLGRSSIESDPIYPAGPATYYLTSKVCAEMFALHRAESSRDTSIVSLRASSIYGPGMKRGLVPTLVSKLRAGMPATLQNGGKYVVDLVHVSDVVAAAISAIDRRVSGPYNIGSSTASSTLEIAHTILDLVGGAKSLLVVEPEDPALPRGYPPISIEKARADLAYAPLTLRAGMRRYIDAQ